MLINSPVNHSTLIPQLSKDKKDKRMQQSKHLKTFQSILTKTTKDWSCSTIIRSNIWKLRITLSRFFTYSQLQRTCLCRFWPKYQSSSTRSVQISSKSSKKTIGDWSSITILNLNSNMSKFWDPLKLNLDFWKVNSEMDLANSTIRTPTKLWVFWIRSILSWKMSC